MQRLAPRSMHCCLPWWLARPATPPACWIPIRTILSRRCSTSLNPALAQSVLERFPSARRQKVIAAAPPAIRQQWIRNEAYPENSIGHMMEPALAVFSPATTVAEATRELRHFVTRAFITYVFVVDEEERLRGVVAMREMLLAGPEQRLDEIMIPDPFHLTPKMPLVEAMKATMVRHYPVYPVCNADGKLIGLIRGQMLFEAETVELSLQAGTMVGVEREERLSTPWTKSFRFRHLWLQGNLFRVSSRRRSSFTFKAPSTGWWRWRFSCRS